MYNYRSYNMSRISWQNNLLKMLSIIYVYALSLYTIISLYFYQIWNLHISSAQWCKVIDFCVQYSCCKINRSILYRECTSRWNVQLNYTQFILKKSRSLRVLSRSDNKLSIFVQINIRASVAFIYMLRYMSIHLTCYTYPMNVIESESLSQSKISNNNNSVIVLSALTCKLYIFSLILLEI